MWTCGVCGAPADAEASVDYGKHGRKRYGLCLDHLTDMDVDGGYLEDVVLYERPAAAPGEGT